MFAALKAIVVSEVRLRMRRLSSMVVLLIVIALSWRIVVDQANGMSLLIIAGQRFVYDSAVLSIGTAMFAAFFMSLFGFFLTRGRMSEDMRYGAGAIIGATQIGNSVFILGRWLGGIAYLVGLMLPFFLTVMVLHLVRSSASIELLPYLQAYALILLPTIIFTVSTAILFDAFAPAMGKTGDVIYILLWIGQVALLASLSQHLGDGWSPRLLVDYLGPSTVNIRLAELFQVSRLTGIGPYDKALPALTMPHTFWSAQIVGSRLAAGAIACLPLLLAMTLFHRYSPDKVKQSRTRKRGSPLDVLNRLVRPLSALVRPLFALASRHPGLVGKTVADVALTLLLAPSVILAVITFPVLGMLMSYQSLPGLVIAALAVWGVLISDTSTRDYQADMEPMTGAVEGGAGQRYVRQMLSACLLGWIMTASVAVRWLLHEPVRAIALLSGIAAMSLLARVLGRNTRSGRPFLTLFLFGLYMAESAAAVLWFDLFGANGLANAMTVTVFGAAALVLGVGDHAIERVRARA